MKKSYYNFIFPGENEPLVLYNSRTGAMAELDKEHAEQLEKLSEKELAEQNPDFAKALLENGFAVEDGVSELDMIRYDMMRTRFGNQALNITIAVTQDCNFGCMYCYEKDVIKKKYMNEEIENAIAEYVEKNLLMEKSLSVCWYGGEPLLALKSIQNLSRKFIEICEQKKASYQASIITNGFLLTADNVKKLIEYKVTHIQVTLDGNEKTHNMRRPLIDGKPTYGVIWNNLLELKKYKNEIKVALRVNVDKNNSRALEEVNSAIDKEGMHDFVYVYPGRVEKVINCHNGEACYSGEEFAKIEQNFVCGEKDILARKYPHPRPFYCNAGNSNAVIFDWKGDVYKCFTEIGQRKACVGNIKDSRINHEEVLHKYLLEDVTQRKKCSTCKYLPICMGGCPKKRLEGENCCTVYKYTMKEYMKYLSEFMKRKNIIT